MSDQFAGKVALVTGGGSGIGRASALAFARLGASVVIADVDVEGGQETVDLVYEIRSKGTFIKTDVSRSADVKAMVGETMDVYGRLDFAHNNAGIFGKNDLSDSDDLEAVWDRVIDINLKGVWLCMQSQIPEMLKQEKGAIVNTASIGGLVGFGNDGIYVASKHGVIGLTKSAALKYADQNIRVNAVCPGYIRTPMTERAIRRAPENKRAGIEQRLAESKPMGRLGTPEEIAESVVWLCSDAASFVTGHAMAVDGGYVAR